MKLAASKDWDLWFIVFGSILLIGSIYILPDSLLRYILGFPFLLFFPGYAALIVFFPTDNEIKTSERLSLSFVLSIAITPMVGFILNQTPFGIKLNPLLLCITSINIVLAIAGLYRRETTKRAFLPFDIANILKSMVTSYRKEGKLDKALNVLLVIIILTSVIAFSYVVVYPGQGESFTEFYILDSNGNTTNYPQNLTINQGASVILGLVNHEHRTVNYEIQVWLCNLTFINNQTQVNNMYLYNILKVYDHNNIIVITEFSLKKQNEFKFERKMTVRFGFKNRPEQINEEVSWGDIGTEYLYRYYYNDDLLKGFGIFERLYDIKEPSKTKNNEYRPDVTYEIVNPQTFN